MKSFQLPKCNIWGLVNTSSVVLHPQNAPKSLAAGALPQTPLHGGVYIAPARCINGREGNTGIWGSEGKGNIRGCF